LGVIELTIIGLIIVVVGVMAIMILLDREAKRKARMLQVIHGQGAVLKSDTNEKDNQNKRRADIANKLKQNKLDDEDAKGGTGKATTADAIAQAGLSISVKQFWVYSLICMVFCTVIAVILGKSPFVVLMVAVISLLGIPRFVLRRKALKRQKEFLEEFPDALEAVATKRMPLTEMAMFATGLAIQAQTGSSLSEVLMNLSGVIRARFRLKRKVKALASEAVASASIIGALPVIVASGMWFVNREYIDILFTTSKGNMWLGIAVGMMMVGVFVMRQMINFKV